MKIKSIKDYFKGSRNIWKKNEISKYLSTFAQNFLFTRNR